MGCTGSKPSPADAQVAPSQAVRGKLAGAKLQQQPAQSWWEPEAQDPRFATVAQLLCAAFQVAGAAVSLPGGGSPAALHAWALLPTAPPPLLVVEDCQADARFKGENFVAGPPFVRFLAGVPLLSASGKVYGTLCIFDTKPCSFTDTQLAVLTTMGAAVVKELDKASQDLGGAVLSPDASLYNFGTSIGAFRGALPQGADTIAEDAVLTPRTASAASNELLLRSLSITAALCAARPSGGSPLSRATSLCRASSTPLSPRAAAAAGAAAGIPDLSRESWFVGDSQTRSAGSLVGADSPMASFMALSASHERFFQCTKLGELLGKGGFGRVYKGTWKGAPVAVKVMDVWLEAPGAPGSEANEKALLEAVLGKELTRHPNLVTTWDWALRPVGGPAAAAAAAAAGEGPHPYQLWIATELCNRGSLYAAIDKGRLRVRNGSASLLYVLYTAQEIAGALLYLHEHEIVHRDLTSTNVLLNASGKDIRRYTVQVADFGLSRFASADHATTRLGTVSHMPPELLTRGTVGTFTDVFSFGVLLYEMYTCQHPFQGLSAPAVIQTVALSKSYPLALPDTAPPDLAALFTASVNYNPAARPGFDSILESLAGMIERAERAAEAAVAHIEGGADAGGVQGAGAVHG